MRAASGCGVVVTIELEPPAGGDVEYPQHHVEERVRLTLVREPNQWRLELLPRPLEGKPLQGRETLLVAETLAELRAEVETRLGDATWHALLKTAGPALESMAPSIMNSPSASERARSR